MDSFKRNIILLATFSIAISYMIIPANADFNLCGQELSADEFNTEIEYDTHFINHVKKPLNYFSKPHSKVYHKIINYYEAFMSPMIFCLWIYTNDNQYYSKIMRNTNLDLTEVWRNSLEELHTYIYINICHHELSDDTSNNAYHKAYHKTTTFYSEMYPTIFCSWINVDVNNDFSHIIWKIDDVDPLEIWRRVVQEIFISTDNIGMYFNLQDHLCFAELRKDGFNTNLEIENTENGQNLTLVERRAVYITTSHGKAYRSMLNKEKVNITSKDFCLRIYGSDKLCFAELRKDGFNTDLEIENTEYGQNLSLVARGEVNITTSHGISYLEMLINEKVNITSKDFCLRIYGSDMNEDGSVDWYILKREIINNTCLDLLHYDGFNISSRRAGMNKKSITEKYVNNLRTQISQEYGFFLRYSDISDTIQNSQIFCSNYSENYVTLMKEYYNTHD